MKKILVVVLILLLTSCGGTMNAEIPKGYISKTEYYDKDGIQDHTDYAKYVYDKGRSALAAGISAYYKRGHQDGRLYGNQTDASDNRLVYADSYDKADRAYRRDRGTAFPV